MKIFSTKTCQDVGKACPQDPQEVSPADEGFPADEGVGVSPLHSQNTAANTLNSKHKEKSKLVWAEAANMVHSVRDPLSDDKMITNYLNLAINPYPIRTLPPCYSPF